MSGVRCQVSGVRYPMTMRGLGSDHVISEPMKGLKINHIGTGQTPPAMEIATTILNRPWGQFSENLSPILNVAPYFGL